jgi:hypothetical protein
MKWMLIPLFFTAFFSHAQLQDFNQKRLQLDKGLMVGLGSWATTNLIVGGIGWGTTPKGEAHYFHQMNFLWNTVNFGLSLPGYFKARNGDATISFGSTIREQHKTETIFLINSGLDIGYISSGFLLRSGAKNNLEKQDQMTGYGNSLILQGGFLFLFDITAYVLHKRHANKKLNGFLDNLEISQSGIGVRWNVSSNQFDTSELTLL